MKTEDIVFHLVRENYDLKAKLERIRKSAEVILDRAGYESDAVDILNEIDTLELYED
jgi:hypothetical protein